jgi:hypothetical protein
MYYDLLAFRTASVYLETNGRVDFPMTTKPCKWYRFSLRTLMVFILLVSLAMGLVVRFVLRAREQAVLVAKIRATYAGSVEYDWQHLNDGTLLLDERNASVAPRTAPPGPLWVRTLIGDDYFQNVVCVSLGSDDIAATSGPSREMVSRIARSFTQLRGLELQGWGPCDSTLKIVGRIPSLELLHLIGESVTDADIAHLRRLKNLRMLMVYPNEGRLTDESIRYLSALPNLEWLVITSDQLSDEGLAYLRRFRSLKNLSLEAYPNRFTDAGLIHLQQMPRLEQLYLHLDGTNITAHGIRSLESVRALRHLRIKGGPVSQSDLDRLGENNPNASTLLLE